MRERGWAKVLAVLVTAAVMLQLPFYVSDGVVSYLRLNGDLGQGLSKAHVFVDRWFTAHFILCVAAAIGFACWTQVSNGAGRRSLASRAGNISGLLLLLVCTAALTITTGWLSDTTSSAQDTDRGYLSIASCIAGIITSAGLLRILWRETSSFARADRPGSRVSPPRSRPAR